jgi:hypothetical protein
MFTRKQVTNPRLGVASATVIGALLAALLLAACGSMPLLIPIPVSSNGEPVVIVLATPTLATEDAYEAAAALSSETLAAAEESAAEAAATEEVATDEDSEAVADPSEEAAAGSDDTVAVAAVDSRSSIPHKYVGREECTECHEAGKGKHASPENHAGYTDELCLFCHEPREEDIVLPELPEDASAEFCLPCHGPYEDLMAKTEDLVEDFDGVTANPHMFVPHESDKIVSCKNCHEVHELPVMASEEIPQADADYCFAACHHEQTFEPCTNCHEEGSGGGE